MKVFMISALLYLACVSPAFSDDAAFCLLLNRVAAEDKLREYTGDHVETGLCLASKATLLAVAARDTATEQICMLSTEYMTREFKRRFPDRDPRDALVKCN